MIADQLDLAGLRRDPKAVKLFISATNVRTGKPRVFTAHGGRRRRLLASACLPNVFRAVEIDGEAYWDGGYLGNPALWPLYHEGGAPDILLVQINAMMRPGAADHARADIINRLNEISFNASLDARDAGDRLRAAPPRSGAAGAAALPAHLPPLHRRRGPDAAFKLSTKLNGDWGFLQELRRYGHEAADRFLLEHFDDLGRESTLDIKRYL